MHIIKLERKQKSHAQIHQELKKSKYKYWQLSGDPTSKSLAAGTSVVSHRTTGGIINSKKRQVGRIIIGHSLPRHSLPLLLLFLTLLLMSF